jgi:uncharacterized membrane protein YbhN (UPF0104 family)
VDASKSDPAAELTLDELATSRRLLHGLISLAILVALVVGLVLAVPGLRAVGRTVEHMRAEWIAAAIGLEVLSCVGYVVAFLQVFERAPIRFGARVALTELAFGAAVSLGGAGSVTVGAWMMIERGAPPARIVERSAVLFLLTSAINVITLGLTGLALFLGVLPGPSSPLLSALPAAVAIAVFAVLWVMPDLADKRLAGRGPAWLRTLLDTSIKSIRQTKALLVKPDWRICGAIAYLWCDIGVLAACFAATGHNPPLTTIVLAYQIGYISNLLPIPGNVGVLDGSLVGMLALYGVNATVATAATIVYHAIALWVPAMWGTVTYVILRVTKNQPLEPRPTLAERRETRAQRRRESRLG